ncbi:MAG: hypothetical protein QM698_02775 [Micropepsaceae bacterium]
MTRFLPIALVLAGCVAGCGPKAEHMIDIPSEGSKYYIMEMKDAGKGRAHVLNRDEGKTGTFFHLREIDCKGKKFRYLGTGRTVEEARDTSKAGVFGPVVEGKSSGEIAKYACEELGL